MAQNTGQTCLEKRGIEERGIQTSRSDYNREEEYHEGHKDAISDGDPQGKGDPNGGGHNHWLPDCSGDNASVNRINYSNFNTDPSAQIGGSYDIKGRNGVGGREWSFANQLYNYESQYGPNSVDTSANRADGQYSVD